MAIDPTKLEQELSIYGTVDDMFYDDYYFSVVMTSVATTSISPVLNILELEVHPDYQTCTAFAYSNENLKAQYVKDIVLPPAGNDAEPA